MTAECITQSGMIDIQIDREVAVIAFNRPEKLNALNVEMRRDIAKLVRHFGDGESVRGIVLTGRGRAFSAGDDLAATTVRSLAGVEATVELFHDITRAILETRVPVIAGINGLAVGGSSEVTLCCDSRVGVPESEFFLPENGIGLSISNASSILLRRLIGNAAIRFVLETRRVNAEEALNLGLLDRIVPSDTLLDSCIEQIHRWTKPGSATRAHLPLLRPQLIDIEAAIVRENIAAREVWESGVLTAGIDRFWKTKV